jgi:predicted nucleic-acid-binding Zn-ribbon protein
MIFETSKQIYEKQMQEVEKEIDDCVEKNTNKLEKSLIILNPVFIKKIFRVENNKFIGDDFVSKEHIKVYKRDKLVYDRIVSYG